MVFTFQENALNICIFTHAPVPQFRQDFLKISLPQDEKGGENYDLLYQNSIRKYKGDLEH